MILIPLAEMSHAHSLGIFLQLRSNGFDVSIWSKDEFKNRTLSFRKKNDTNSAIFVWLQRIVIGILGMLVLYTLWWFMYHYYTPVVYYIYNYTPSDKTMMKDYTVETDDVEDIPNIPDNQENHSEENHSDL